jgi:hypothetical protein
MATLSHAVVAARHRPVAVDLAATLATTATHLLQARRQRTDNGQKQTIKTRVPWLPQPIHQPNSSQPTVVAASVAW